MGNAQPPPDDDPNAKLREPPANLGDFYDPRRRAMGWVKIGRAVKQLFRRS